MTKLASEWVDNRPFASREIENNASEMLMQNFGGTTKSIMVFLKKAYCRVNYLKLAPE